jgi:hypothetical protein
LQRDGIVFVFGAGASKSEDAPLTSELLYETLTQLNGDKMVNELKEFLRDFFQIDVDHPTKNRLPTFEEALTLVEIALERQENFSAKMNGKKLSAIRDSLVYSLGAIIDLSLGDKGKFHDPFVNNLYNLNEGLWQKFSFVNLNYDLLLDNALVRLYKRKNLYLDYGIDFRNFIPPIPRNEMERGGFIQDLENWERPIAGQSILLLKPHGSLNWLHCPTCNTIKTTKTEKGNLRIYREHEKCVNDRSLQTILIVPPTWGNYYENPFLVTILEKTHEAIKKAKKIFFVGCSLSDYDIELKYLFKRALYPQPEEIRPEIVVIQDKKETSKAKNELIDRYCRFFGSDITFDFNGFENFSAHAPEFLT